MDFTVMNEVKINDKVFRKMIDESAILQRVQEMADRINLDYAQKSPLVLIVLNGAFIFAADLLRRLNVGPEIQFIKISSYRNAMVAGELEEVSLGKEVIIEGRDLLIVEDIIDTGTTGEYLRAYAKVSGACSIRLACLLFKPDNFTGKHLPEYIGFEIPSDFVVGYGLDYAQKGRELRHIYTLAG